MEPGLIGQGAGVEEMSHAWKLEESEIRIDGVQWMKSKVSRL
jgi:hypothetical protein